MIRFATGVPFNHWHVRPASPLQKSTRGASGSREATSTESRHGMQDHAVGFNEASRESVPMFNHYLTVLFSDVYGSVGLSKHMHIMDFADLLKRLRTVGREVVGDFGGTVARLQGDGLLAFFWLHGSVEDGLRATACALELHTSMRSSEQLSLHSGVHAGITYLETGDVERGRYDLVGSTPNLAARLASLAEAGEILASERVIAPHLSTFSTSSCMRVSPRGWSEPIPVYRVIGYSDPKVASLIRHGPAIESFTSSQLPLRAVWR